MIWTNIHIFKSCIQNFSTLILGVRGIHFLCINDNYFFIFNIIVQKYKKIKVVVEFKSFVVPFSHNYNL